MSSVARAVGRAAMCARTLRTATDDTSFREAKDRLAGAIRDEALRVLVINGIPAQHRDDLAQAVTLKVLDRIVEGAVAPGFEDGYVAVAAKNRARDWHRESSGVYEKTECYEDESLIAPGPDPLAELVRQEDEADMRLLEERVARVLESAPVRYREVLVAVYLDGIPIDSLVDQELFREWPVWPVDGTDADEHFLVRRRARARIDKLLQRARDWMRSRLVAAAPVENVPVSRASFIGERDPRTTPAAEELSGTHYKAHSTVPPR